MSKPKSPRKVGEKEALALATSVRGSPQKLNLVAALIRNKPAGDALHILQFSTKAMAVDVRQCREQPQSRRGRAGRKGSLGRQGPRHEALRHPCPRPFRAHHQAVL